MVWQDYSVDGEKITLTRQEIQEARDHYSKVADKFKPKKSGKTDIRYGLYLGKADAMNDILKMFEALEG